MKLLELPVLVMDCQATSSSPARGHLLEMAWSKTSACSTAPETISRSASLPDGVAIPPRVVKVTGMREPNPEGGSSPVEIYDELAAAARDVGPPCPTVVHFASFEQSYLRFLHYRVRKDRGDEDFPFLFVCTHRMAKRLLPDLPRHGLRAVAGYFGHGVGEFRRSSDHVRATAAVWRSLVTLVEEDLPVSNLDALLEWMSIPPRRSGRRSFPMPSRVVQALPRSPGVYRMLRENGDVLYVGKATLLKERVQSYFQPNASHRDSVLEMLSQAKDVEVTPTGSALEAALLEADEIKRLSPPYNHALRSRERTLLFASRDFMRFSVDPEEHPVGPLAGGESLWRTFSLLAARARGEDAEPSEHPWLADEGLEIFWKRLGGTALLAHGAREWLRRTDPSESETELELKAPYGAARASPESVADQLDDAVCRCSHLVRRASFFALLSESTLVWRGRDGEDVVLVLEGGAARDRAARPTDPPGYRRSFADRRKRIDLAAYDRLCVLTREIRRLVAEGRFIDLHIGPAARLDAAKLARLLRWT